MLALGICESTEICPIQVNKVEIDESAANGKAKGPLIRVRVVLSDGTVRVLQALMDTGAQCNLIGTRILEPAMFQNSENPLRLVTATGESLPGGALQVATCLLF